jgi:hypothetical protein
MTTGSPRHLGSHLGRGVRGSGETGPTPPEPQGSGVVVGNHRDSGFLTTLLITEAPRMLLCLSATLWGVAAVLSLVNGVVLGRTVFFGFTVPFLLITWGLLEIWRVETPGGERV